MSELGKRMESEGLGNFEVDKDISPPNITDNKGVKEDKTEKGGNKE